jgi:60S ribosome subunit biogenesis protein NIP7
VVKTGLGRITENTPKYNGVIVYTMNDVPLVSFCLMLG